ACWFESSTGHKKSFDYIKKPTMRRFFCFRPDSTSGYREVDVDLNWILSMPYDPDNRVGTPFPFRS
ncbi:MAG: hypothetical protein ACK5U7_11810, partial [Bacteroidota bacterium]